MNKRQSVKVLVTGASGFIGSRVARFLASQGGRYEVVCLVRSPLSDALPKGEEALEVIVGECFDTAQMAEILATIQADIVLHCAGVTSHHDAEDDIYHRINVEGGRTVLDAVKKYGKAALINYSSVGVYGVPQSADGIVHEDDACRPLSAYAQSKYDFEQVLNGQDAVRFVNLRIANIPGRDAFINYVLSNGKVVFKGDSPYVRDYIHLDDLCALCAAATDYLVKGGQSCTLNAGSGVGFAFDALVDEIERQTTQAIDRQYNPAKTGDVLRVICDITRAKAVLNWSPQYTDIKDIIEYALRQREISAP